MQYLGVWKDRTILIDEWHQFNDNSLQYIQAPIGKFCITQIEAEPEENEKEWTESLKRLEKSVVTVLQSSEDFHEGIIAKLVSILYQKGIILL